MSKALTRSSQFHGYYDNKTGPHAAFQPGLAVILQKARGDQKREVSYRFHTHFHPYVTRLVSRLIEKSVSGLQAMDTEYAVNPDGTSATLPGGKPRPLLYEEMFSNSLYKPSSKLVDPEYPVKQLDFTSGGAYSVYNWELFYHVPLTIAIHLSKNQRFEEAQHWFHYIFDPTDDSDGPTPERFWKVKPLQTTDVQLIEEILVNLSSGLDQGLREQTVQSIHAWKDSPFRPHAVARYRQTSHMFKAVMAYLDNLIAWGDSLFRQDTGESINEATLLYVLAANILGPRPQAVPKKGTMRPQTYANLRAGLDELGNALGELETDIAFDLFPHPTEVAEIDRLSTARSLGNALYFCIPRNDKLLGYWDSVADRLFKIRNSLNMQGVFRQLPLFEPPIDPALLAKAAASGLDVGAIISGLSQPLPLVRFMVLVQKAVEVCQEVKSLGNNLLSAIEKEDNEALGILRARHERVILDLVEKVRYAQWQEAVKAREGLEVSFGSAAARYIYYEGLLGEKGDDISQKIPVFDDLDTGSLEKMKLNQGETSVEKRPIDFDIAETLDDILSAASLKGTVSSHEVEEMVKLKESLEDRKIASAIHRLGAVLAYIPEFSIEGEPWGVGAAMSIGGKDFSNAERFFASFYEDRADQLTYESSGASKAGAYARRAQEWAFQSNLAADELFQILKQRRAAQIREYVAEREWRNQQQQIEHSKDIEDFLTGEKNTSGHKRASTQALYAWIKREAKGLYGQVFQLAFDIAKKAERALQHELGDPELSFLQFGYLAGKQGLLAGEKLYLDIKRMETAYHDLNQREYELTTHVSLLQVSPLALLQLRTTGRCTVTLPEALFDMDGPGHYFRRIKSVAISVPCVSGPYTSANCTLTMLKSSIRKSAVIGNDGYARTGAEDSRFSDHYGSLNSIVTSSGQNDSGMFETNLRDERYLPFEGSGVISEWQLQLPANPGNDDPQQFDYSTISDVILHIRYTAREAGGLMRSGAIDNLKTLIDGGQGTGSVRLFAVRHEFSTEWGRFQSQTPAAGNRFGLTLDLREEHYPFWSEGRLNKVVRLDILARSTADPIPGSMAVFDKAESTETTAMLTLVRDASMGNLLTGSLSSGEEFKPVGEIKLYLDNKNIQDLWIAITWGSE